MCRLPVTARGTGSDWLRPLLTSRAAGGAIINIGHAEQLGGSVRGGSRIFERGGVHLRSTSKKGGGGSKRGSNFGPNVKKPTSWPKGGGPDPLAPPPGSATGFSSHRRSEQRIIYRVPYMSSPICPYMSYPIGLCIYSGGSRGARGSGPPPLRGNSIIPI